MKTVTLILLSVIIEPAGKGYSVMDGDPNPMGV